MGPFRPGDRLFGWVLAVAVAILFHDLLDSIWLAGLLATAVMAGETALSLALDGDSLPVAAGSLTPASALGTVLVERLRAAGHTYEVTALD